MECIMTITIDAGLCTKKVQDLYKHAIYLQSTGKFHTAFVKINFLAEKGFIPAQFDLGWLYYNGRGVSRDLGKAIYWWKVASKNGYKDAALMLKTIKTHRKSVYS